MMKRIKILLGTLMVVLTLGIVFSFNTFAAGTGFADATEISVNTTVRDNLSKYIEEDYYVFKLSSAANICVDFKHENLYDSKEYWTIALFDSHGNEIAYQSVSGMGDKRETCRIGLDVGTYYLRIRGGSWNNGWYGDGYGYSECHSNIEYSFVVKHTKTSVWEKENNEDFGSASIIELNQAYNGTVNDNIDVDVYKFVVKQPGYICVNFEHKNLYDSKEYWTIAIFNSSTNQLYNFSVNAIDENVKTCKIGLDVGTYYLRIRGGSWNDGWHGSGYGYSNCHSNTEYSFTVKYSKNTYWEREYNEDFNGSSITEFNKTYNGTIKDRVDRDFYKIIIKKRTNLKIVFNNQNMNNSLEYYIVKVYTSDANEIISHSVFGDNTQTNILGSLDAGTYFIEVKGGRWNDGWHGSGYGYSENYTDADYNFKVTVQVPNPSNLRFAYSTSAIKLAWDKVSGATGYKVYKYDTKKKKYVEIANTKKTSYKESNLKAGTEYKYAVRAYTKVDGVTYYSSYVKITTATSPAQVTNLKVTSSNFRTCVVSYSKVSGATGYQIYYSTSKNGTYKKLATTSKTKYTDKKFGSRRTYYIKVRAYKKVSGKTVYGAFSTVKSVKIK